MTLKSGHTKLTNPGQAEYYRRLRLVISGPLCSRARLLEIVRFNLGKNDQLLQAQQVDKALPRESP